jgi:PIN domain nuclease of toxin-antitoxin system
MTRYVTDTHAFVWHLQSSPQLSEPAATVFRAADAGKNEILVPSIVLVELVYLAERGRIQSMLVNQAFDVLADGSINYRVVPLDTKTVRALQSIDPAKIPEMPDRIIAATAKQLNVSLITRDHQIAKSGFVVTVW